MKTSNIVRHHLLEIILWPNEDGTFRKILNSADRLKELGIYNQYNLCIQMTRAEHASLHCKGNPICGEHSKGKPSPFKWKKHTTQSKEKISKSKRGVTKTLFGEKYKEHFGICARDNLKQYKNEYNYYIRHNYTFSWEIL